MTQSKPRLVWSPCGSAGCLPTRHTQSSPGSVIGFSLRCPEGFSFPFIGHRDEHEGWLVCRWASPRRLRQGGVGSLAPIGLLLLVSSFIFHLYIKTTTLPPKPFCSSQTILYTQVPTYQVLSHKQHSSFSGRTLASGFSPAQHPHFGNSSKP